jgi:hypothetical protein
MLYHERLTDVRMARVEAALGRCAWRRMSPRAVAMCLAPSSTARWLRTTVASGWWSGRLSACRWRSLTLAGVAGQAAAALETWHASCRLLDLELTRLLDREA